MKRFISVLLACAMCTLFSTSVFAAEKPSQAPSQEATEEVSVVETEASERALGTLLATNGGTIYNGLGSIRVTLPSGNFSTDFVAVLGYCEVDTIVTCTVNAPDGSVYNLGTMSGNGDSSEARTVFYAPAGTYTFNFVTGTSHPVEVACFIYD